MPRHLLEKVPTHLCPRILMVQTMLFPNENLQTYPDTSGGPAYPGRDQKLRHLEWLFINFLLQPRNVLAARLGMYGMNEEAVAEKVVLAAASYADCGLPADGPAIPTVEMCVQLNNAMPFTHNVLSSEERTSLGFPSGGAWPKDCFKILAGKVPLRFPGESAMVSYVLPTLNKGATEAWTNSTLPHPHHIDKAEGGVADTF